MRQKITLLLLAGLSFASSKFIFAGAPAGESTSPHLRIAAACAPANSRTNLQINSIRFTVMSGGERWSKIGSPPNSTPGFEVPANSGKIIVFTSSLWLAAKDDNQVLHVAAQTYRQSSVLGVGFWPGPLGTGNNLNIDSVTCRLYDRIWQVTKSQIDQHKTQFNQPGYQMPIDIAQWPANGRSAYNEAQYLAPFADLNGNAVYEPQLGEYPLIAGDQGSWHVYNALGGVSGSGSPPMGLEIQEENFAYAGESLLNQAAFFRLKIINRSNRTYDSLYTGIFIDPDIGGGNDDFIGCDVSRNLGYAYNGDGNDDGIGGYGLNPPAFGLLQLEGPFAPINDGFDNDRNGQIDEMKPDCDGQLYPERMAITAFRYFNNDGTVIGNPTNSRHVMQFLSGVWKDGSAQSYGGSGYLGSQGSTNVPYSFAFSGNSDPNGWGYVYAGGTATSPPFSWTEQQNGSSSSPNLPGDRRFVMSNGKIQMLPGALQVLTYAGMWGRDSLSADSAAAMTQLLAVSDFVQQQYNNCFLALPNIITTSSNTLQKQNNWTVYPNPVEDGRIYVKGDFDPVQAIQIKLVDMQGRKHPVTLSTADMDRLTITTSASAGLYLIEISQGGQRKLEKVFVR